MQDQPATTSLSVKERRRLLEVKAKAIGEQIQSVKTSPTSKKLPPVPRGNTDDLDEFMEKIHSLEFRLQESTEEAERLRAKAEEAVKDRNVFKEKAFVLGAKVSALKEQSKTTEEAKQALAEENEVLTAKVEHLNDQLKSTERTINKSYHDTLDAHESAIQAAQEQIANLDKENDQLRSLLTEAQRVTQFLESKTQAAEEKLVSQESESQSKIADLQFQLTESQRICKFLEGKLQKHADGDDEETASGSSPLLTTKQENQGVPLKEHAALQRRFQETQLDMEALRSMNEDLESRVEQLKDEVKKTETALNKSYNCTLDSLTEHIQALQEQNQALDQENDTLRFQAAEAKRVCQFLERKMADGERSRSSSTSDPECELTEAQRVSRLQSKLENVLEEKTGNAIESPIQNDAAVVEDEDLASSTIASLQVEKEELLAKVAELKEQVKSTETTLNKSYNETLDSLYSHIQTLEANNTELDQQNDELRFSLTEAQRVCEFLKNKISESENSNASKVADLQFKLTEAQRVSKFLESKLEKVLAERQTDPFLQQIESKTLDFELDENSESYSDGPTPVNNRVSHLEDQNENLVLLVKKLKREVRDVEETLNKSYNDALESLTAHIKQSEDHIEELDKENDSLRFSLTEAKRITKYLESKLDKAMRDKQTSTEVPDLKFKLTEAQRVSKYLETKLQKVIDGREGRTNTADDTLVADLQFKLADTRRVTNFLQTKLEKLLKEKQEEEVKVSDLSFRLTEAQRVSKFLESKVETLLNEKSSMVQAIDDLQFKVTESQRVSKFLEGKLTKVLDASRDPSAQITFEQSSNLCESTEKKSHLEEKVNELESSIRLIKQESKNNETALNKSYNETLASLSTHVEALQRHIAKIESQNEDLWTSLAQLQGSSQSLAESTGHDSLASRHEDNDLRHRFHEASRVFKLLETKLRKAQVEIKEVEDRVSATDLDNSELEFKLHEAQRVCRYLQDKLHASDNQHQTELAEMKFKLTESNRVCAFLEGKLTHMIDVVKSADVVSVEARKSVSELHSEIHQLGKENSDLSFGMKEAQRVCKYLESKLLETQRDYKIKVDDLQFKLTESVRVTRFLEGKLNETMEQKNALLEKAVTPREVHSLSIVGNEAIQDKTFELGSKVSSLRKDLEEKEAILFSLEEDNHDLEEKVLMLEDEIKTNESYRSMSYDDGPSTLTSRLQQSEERIADLTKENDELRVGITEAQRAAEQLKERMNVTTSEQDSSGSIDDLKFKMLEAQRVCRFLEAKAGELVKEKQQALAKVTELEEQCLSVPSISRELEEKENQLDDLRKKNQDLELLVLNLKQEVKDTEEHLNKSYNDTLSGLSLHIQETEAHIKELEAENARIQATMVESAGVMDESGKDYQVVLDDLRFKLSEAQRVSKFLEGKVLKMVEEKRASDEQIRKLEYDLAQGPSSEDAPRSASSTPGQPTVEGATSSTTQGEETTMPPDLIHALHECLSIARVTQKAADDRVAALTTKVAEKEAEARLYHGQWEAETKKTETLAGKVADLQNSESLHRERAKTLQAEKQLLALRYTRGTGPFYFM